MGKYTSTSSTTAIQHDTKTVIAQQANRSLLSIVFRRHFQLRLPTLLIAVKYKITLKLLYFILASKQNQAKPMHFNIWNNHHIITSHFHFLGITLYIP